MKRTDGLVQCKCREWRKPEELCLDLTCIYCEGAEVEEEPSVEELEPTEFDLAFDVNDLADGYEVDDEDEDEWWGAF